MRRIFPIIFFLGFTAFLNAQVITVDALRKEYNKVAGDSASCFKLYNKVVKDNSTDNLMIGYKGAISATMANHVKNRSEKLKLFNAGKKLIEQSIHADEDNVELRFLRFTIQTNCPKALGYNEQIPSDKEFILSHLDSVKNISLKKKMSTFLLESKHLTDAEKKRITIDKP